MSDGETVYDEQIAPLLEQLGEVCMAHGMPMLAAVWYEPENHGFLYGRPNGLQGTPWEEAVQQLDALALQLGALRNGVDHE